MEGVAFNERWKSSQQLDFFQLAVFCLGGPVNHKGQPTGRNVYLRYYPPVAQKDMGKKKREDLPVFEQVLPILYKFKPLY